MGASSALETGTTMRTSSSVRGSPLSTTQVGQRDLGYVVTAASRKEIEIYGEHFLVTDCGHEGIVLSHPQWSLSGEGRSHFDAYRALLVEAAELADDLRQDDVKSLSTQARRLREFVLRIS